MCQVMGVQLDPEAPVEIEYDHGCPFHYKGDGFVTCSVALRSMLSNIEDIEPMQLWWLACAFKYTWRCMTKGQTLSDIDKAIDCLQKLREEVVPTCSTGSA